MTGTWVGVVLNEPLGKNNGSVLKKQYFQCRDNYGVFVQPHAVSLLRARCVAGHTAVSICPLSHIYRH